MRSSLLATCICACLALAPASSGAQDSRAKDPYQRRSDGWHFYQTPPKKSARKPVVPPQAPAPPLTPALAAAVPAPDSELMPLSTAWIAKNLPKYREVAIDDPSPANVELVAYLERLSLDKAERYAQARMQVNVSNPVLDEFARSPLTGVQRAAAEVTISQAKQQALARIAQRVGLWYFFSSTCPYCAKQEPILDRFQARTGFSILPISLDGGPLASGSPKKYVLNQGQGERLGVMTTPTLVVADTSTGRLLNLAAGLRTISEIEDRLLQLGRAEKWISDKEYDEAVRGEQRRFLTDGLKNLQQLENDPDALLKTLRDASINGGSTPWAVRPQSQGQ